MPRRIPCLLFCFVLTWFAAGGQSAEQALTPDQQLRAYFELATTRVEQASQQALSDPQAWLAQQEVAREQLAEMLGLSPRPERTPLHATITGEIEQPDFVVKNLHYQALPGLYVTANLYLPKQIEKPCPAILYVCGHARVHANGVSYGNKVGYHHHGIWYARNGYVCLTIDTIQLGEFQGVHHGTHNKGWWWWNSRGYTPAGVETWNGMRGLDYLQSLPEVDPKRIGVTGRSGGGAYSWYIAALDTRITAAVPVAGITSMRNHIVDDCIEGHCDCMYMVNTHGWDFAQLAALVAPRPLLLTNTDKDSIFPLDGVVDVFRKTRHVYTGIGASQNLGLAISEGPHKDTQRLQVNAFEWFDRFLKKEEAQALPTEKLFEPEQLRVFQQLPTDERTSRIHESFVPVAQAAIPNTPREWTTVKAEWRRELSRQCFPKWPASTTAAPPRPLETERREAGERTTFVFTSEEPFELTFQRDRVPQSRCRVLTIHLTDSAAERSWNASPEGDAITFAPRGYAENGWSGNEKQQTHIRRRFALLGQSLDAGRLWDVCQLIRSVRQLPEYQECQIELQAEGELAGLALYVPVMGDVSIARLRLEDLPASHHQGPEFLNVLRILDIPQTLALAGEACPVELSRTPKELLDYAWKIQRVPETRMHPITLKEQAGDL